MVIASGLRRPPSGASAIGEGVLGAALDAAERATHRCTRSRTAASTSSLQEAVTLVDHAGLARRPRLSRVRSSCGCSWRSVGDGWRVMPGGFVRVADDVDARAVNLQRGGRTADAWVLSDRPVAEATLIPAPDRIAIQPQHRGAAEPGSR